jgi:hypothetical protein
MSMFSALNLVGWWQSLGDRRRALRHSLHQFASIDVGNGSLSSCMISDISETGARLTVGGKLPDEFTLLLHRRCRVVRRSDGQIGVKFVSGK